MRKYRQDDLTSFELLLDTMCNTFGGIVFIALLLTILSQAIGNSNTENTPVEPRPEPEINTSQSEIQGLRDQSNELTTLRNDLEARLNNSLMDIALTKDKIERQGSELERLTEAVDHEKKMRERPLRLPRLHAISKVPVFLAIQHGKFYAINDVSTSYNRHRVYDRSDIGVRESGGDTAIDTLPGRGQVIKEGAEKFGKLKQAITNINPQNEFVSFAVDRNSFAEFIYVKNLFIQQGFDYHWVVQEGTIHITKTSGTLKAL